MRETWKAVCGPLTIFSSQSSPASARAMQRLHNLRSLRLFFFRESDGNLMNWIFAGFRKLKCLAIDFLDRDFESTDFWNWDKAAVARLVASNPSIHTFRWSGFYMTDAFLVSLSALPNLRSVHIKQPAVEGGYTADGVLSLVRCASRHRLREVKVAELEPGRIHEIQAEAELIGQETGTTAAIRVGNSCLRIDFT